MNNESNFQPNWISVPGDTISDILKERQIPLDEFASQLKCSTDYLNELLSGFTSITEEVAKKLELSLGISAEFWIKRQQQYVEDSIRLKKLEEKTWLDELPISDMVNRGWIKKTNNLLTECLNFFHVPDINTWKQKYSETIAATTFRTSKSIKSNTGSISAWLRQGELIASRMQCESWNEKLFEETLTKTIRPLTRIKEPKDFLPLLIKACADCGVAVVILKTPSGCSASGATKFINPQRALLLLSFRYLSDDQFWFTFFHEAGHLILHGNKKVFIESVGLDINRTIEEKDASTFAGEMLIPHDLQTRLKSLSGKWNIARFAELAGVSTGIVVGQMQFHNYIGAGTLNGFKRRYAWEDIISNEGDSQSNQTSLF